MGHDFIAEQLRKHQEGIERREQERRAEDAKRLKELIEFFDKQAKGKGRREPSDTESSVATDTDNDKVADQGGDQDQPMLQPHNDGAQSGLPAYDQPSPPPASFAKRFKCTAVRCREAFATKELLVAHCKKAHDCESTSQPFAYCNTCP